MSGVDTAHAASFVDSEMAGVNSPPFINGAAAASEAFDRLLAEVRACTLCAPHLPQGPRPVLRGRPSARLLIISQAPGARVHETGISFNDRSGDRLREWLALDREIFYDESRVAIMRSVCAIPTAPLEAATCRRAASVRHAGTRRCARSFRLSS